MKLLITASLLISVTFSIAAQDSKNKIANSESAEEVLKVSRSLKADNHNKVNAQAEIKYLDDFFAKAPAGDHKELMKILEQLSFTPSHKDPITGTQIFKVTNVVKGSFFEKEGLKAGDLFANGASPKKPASN